MHFNFAKRIGCSLAYVQHGIDKSFEWSFHKVRCVGEEKLKKKRNENKHLFRAKKLGKATLAFLGTLGDSFYDKYEELKTQETQKNLLH